MINTHPIYRIHHHPFHHLYHLYAHLIASDQTPYHTHMPRHQPHLMLGTVGGKYVHMYLGIKVYRCVSKHFLLQADRMADTLLRIEHHLTKSLDALRYDIGTVKEEVRGLKEGLKRKKKVLIAMYISISYLCTLYMNCNFSYLYAVHS